MLSQIILEASITGSTPWDVEEGRELQRWQKGEGVCGGECRQWQNGTWVEGGIGEGGDIWASEEVGNEPTTQFGSVLISHDMGCSHWHLIVMPQLALSCDMRSVLGAKPYQGFSSVMHKCQVELHSRLMWEECQVEPMLKTSGGKTNWRSTSGWVCEAKDEGPRCWEMMKVLSGTTQEFPVWFWRLCRDCGRS